MSKKLFVGGLAWATTDASLRAAFEAYGTVIEAKVICDHATGRSRGFGFVTFESEDAASAAREALHEKELDGRMIRINDADESSKRPAQKRTAPRPQNNEHREPREPREPRQSDTRKSFSQNDFAYMPDANAGRGGRDNRRKDRKKDRDRFDDDRW